MALSQKKKRGSAENTSSEPCGGEKEKEPLGMKELPRGRESRERRIGSSHLLGEKRGEPSGKQAEAKRTNLRTT